MDIFDGFDDLREAAEDEEWKEHSALDGDGWYCFAGRGRVNYEVVDRDYKEVV
jgi:hypothetical protein